MTRKEVVVAVTAATVTAVAAAVLTGRWVRRKERRRKQTQRILRKFARECATPVSKLWEVADAFVADMTASLTAAAAGSCGSLNMVVSFAGSLPSGDEKGVHYGVNLRGKELLLLRGTLEGNEQPLSYVQKQEIPIPIPDNVLNGSFKELCDFISLELVKFLGMNPVEETEEVKNLGFTLTRFVEQNVPGSISRIQRKSLADGDDDTDLKEFMNEMNESLERHGLKIRMNTTLVDNTVGELAGGRYYHKDTVAAVSLGMGTNAAYIEQAQEISRWKSTIPEPQEIVISTEWGDFRSCHLPLTEYDAALDAESWNPGSRVFEKMVSGGYLGEIVRRVLLRMSEESGLFGDTLPPKLMVPYMLWSPDMAAMHQDISEDREIVNRKLKEVFGIMDSSVAAREVVVEVCDVVAERAARVAGAGIVGMIKKLGRLEKKMSIVIVEGGLYDHYRVFRNYLHSSVWEMLGDELSDHVVIEHSHGGSAAGALFLGACGKQDFES
ncbi:putative hexokinase-like 2 protein [Cardamine amara subsp. amara]|uniref:Phosphotransferase n=1 Tax=Cardamine amara subsp. amara TaxID=228776 RepID=A0ABD0Z6R9_CARAN